MTRAPSPAMIVALIALLISLAGVAGVGVLLTRTTTGATIEDGTVEQADLSSSVQAQLTARRGPRGAQGVRGLQGERGPRGAGPVGIPGPAGADGTDHGDEVSDLDSRLSDVEGRMDDLCFGNELVSGLDYNRITERWEWHIVTC